MKEHRHRWRFALIASLALGAGTPALAQTMVSNGQRIVTNGDYQIPEGVGTITIKASGGGGGGGGAAGSGNGGHGGHGAQVTATRSNASAQVYTITLGSGGNGGSPGYYSSGTYCGGKASNGHQTTVSLKGNGSQIAKAAGGWGGAGGCSTAAHGTAGENGRCDSLSSSPNDAANCSRDASRNGGSGGWASGAGATPAVRTGKPGGAGAVTISWEKATQTLTCPSLAPQTLHSESIPLVAISSSSYSGAISYTGAGPGNVCSISGNALRTGSQWGTCSYTVQAAGNVGVEPATQTCSVEVQRPEHVLNGSISGLASNTPVRLYNNGALVFTAPAGSSSYQIGITGTQYAITAEAANHSCSVANGTGTVTAETTDVNVTCVPNSYPISGTVTGLTGGVVTLTVGEQSTTVTGSGTQAFSMPNALRYGQAYNLTARHTPDGITCTPSNGSGSSATGPVSNATVSCATSEHAFSAQVTGLGSGKTLTLKVNDTPHTVTGPAQAHAPLGYFLHGSTYALAIERQPTGQTCTLNSTPHGTANAPVVVAIACVDAQVSDRFDNHIGTWTVPAGVYAIHMEAAAGGGGGGVSSFNFDPNFNAQGTAGANGAKVVLRSYPVTPGQVLSYRIGAGGAGGTSNFSGAGGGSTGIYLGANPAENQIPLILAGGGQGGGIAVSPTPAEPAQAGRCDPMPSNYAGRLGNGKGSRGTQGGGGVDGIHSTQLSTGGGGGGAGPTPSTPQGGQSYAPNAAECNSEGGLGSPAAPFAFVPPPTAQPGGNGWVHFWADRQLGSQTLTCGTAAKTWGDADFAFPTPSVSTSTGDPAGAITHGNVGGACSLVNNQLHINSGGNCTYTVYAAQTEELAAASANCSVPVNKATASLTLNGANALLTGRALTLTAQLSVATNQPAVTWRTTTPSICSVTASGEVTGLLAGQCTIWADWPGDDNFNALNASKVLAVSVPIHTISGSVSGLVGGQNATVAQGANTQSVANGGSFTFSGSEGSAYAVSATAPHHSCAVVNGTGNLLGNVSNVVVTCVPHRYTLGYSVTGLADGQSLTVMLGDTHQVHSTNGAGSFNQGLSYAQAYQLSIAQHPVGQVCTVSPNGQGSSPSADVNGVSVICSTATYALNYTVSGLSAGNTLVVSLGGSNQTHTADGAGHYPAALVHGQAYALSIATQAAGQTCTVSANGQGSSASADVNGVSVSCITNDYPLTGGVQPAMAGTVSCSTSQVRHGEAASCTAQAHSGWRFAGFDTASACTRTSGADGSVCELDDVQAARTATATFTPHFTGTTVPASGTGSPASATFTGGGDNCRFDLDGTGFEAAPADLPAAQQLPQGIFRLKLVDCEPRAQVRVSVTWPEAITAYLKYGKASPSATQSTYFELTEAHDLLIEGSTAHFTLTDGALGDDDWEANGTLIDPTAPAAPKGGVSGNVQPVPALGGWPLGLLGLLTLWLGAHTRRKAMRV